MYREKMPSSLETTDDYKFPRRIKRKDRTSHPDGIVTKTALFVGSETSGLAPIGEQKPTPT